MVKKCIILVDKTKNNIIVFKTENNNLEIKIWQP